MKLLESDWTKSLAKQLVSAINGALAMAPSAQKHLKNLEGCSLNVHFKGLDTNLYFGVEQADQLPIDKKQNLGNNKYKVQLVDASPKPNVFITGTPLAFVKLITQKNKAALFQAKELELQGDAVRIQQILAFLSALEIDWEGILANFIGDVPAHFLGTSIRSGLMWGLNFSQSLIRDTEEFIKFELRLLPDKKQAKNQFSAISKLADELDKLKIRFDQLELKLKK